MPKQFKFRLDPVLRLRQQQADQAKRVVAERLRRIGDVQREIGVLDSQIAAQTNAMRAGPMVGRLDIKLVARHRTWLSHLQRGVLDGMARTRQLQAVLVDERAALAEASKRVKILETLRDRQSQRYHKELARLELAESDEMNTQRYIYQQHSEA